MPFSAEHRHASSTLKTCHSRSAISSSGNSLWMKSSVAPGRRVEPLAPLATGRDHEGGGRAGQGRHSRRLAGRPSRSHGRTQGVCSFQGRRQPPQRFRSRGPLALLSALRWTHRGTDATWRGLREGRACAHCFTAVWGRCPRGLSSPRLGVLDSGHPRRFSRDGGVGAPAGRASRPRHDMLALSARSAASSRGSSVVRSVWTWRFSSRRFSDEPPLPRVLRKWSHSACWNSK